MRIRSKLLLGGLAAALVMSFAVGTASANRLSVNEGSLSIVFTRLAFNSAVGEIACPLRLAGSFHRTTIVKTARALTGSITSAVIDNQCDGGSATVLTATLPWHLQYGSFSGTLPRISALGLRIVGAAFQYQSEGARCLIVTSTTEPLALSASVDTATGVIDSLRASEGSLIDLGGEFLCDFAGDAFYFGTASMERPPPPLILRLI